MRTKAEELKHNQEAQASTIAELALKATIYAQARKIEDKLEAVLVKLDLSQAQALGELAVEAVELQGKLERCYLDTPASQVKLEALQALLAQVEAIEANQAELEKEEQAKPQEEQAELDLGEALEKAEAYPKLEKESKLHPIR